MKSIKNKSDKQLFSVMQWGINYCREHLMGYSQIQNERKHEMEGALDSMQTILTELRMRFDI